MTSRFARALRRAEERDRLARFDASGQNDDGGRLGLHFAQVSGAIDIPGNLQTVLAVRGGVKCFTGAEVGIPGVPCLARFWQAARSIAGDQQTISILGAYRVIPAFCENGHKRASWCKELHPASMSHTFRPHAS